MATNRRGFFGWLAGLMVACRLGTQAWGPEGNGYAKGESEGAAVDWSGLRIVLAPGVSMRLYDSNGKELHTFAYSEITTAYSAAGVQFSARIRDAIEGPYVARIFHANGRELMSADCSRFGKLLPGESITVKCSLV